MTRALFWLTLSACVAPMVMAACTPSRPVCWEEAVTMTAPTPPSVLGGEEEYEAAESPKIGCCVTARLVVEQVGGIVVARCVCPEVAR